MSLKIVSTLNFSNSGLDHQDAEGALDLRVDRSSCYLSPASIFFPNYYICINASFQNITITS